MKDRYYLIGVVTGNPSSCSGKTLPDVYNYVGNEEVLFQIVTETAITLIISILFQILKWISSYTDTNFSLSIDEDKSCPTKHRCVVKERCPAIQTLYEKKDSPLSSARDKFLALNELKSLICNHKERGFCCKPGMIFKFQLRGSSSEILMSFRAYKELANSLIVMILVAACYKVAPRLHSYTSACISEDFMSPTGAQGVAI